MVTTVTRAHGTKSRLHGLTEISGLNVELFRHLIVGTLDSTESLVQIFFYPTTESV